MKKTSFLWILFVSAILSFFLSYLLVYSVLHAIQNFMEISSRVANIVIVATSLLLSAINVIFTIVQKRKLKESKARFWMSQNWPKLLLSYLILLVFFMSLTNSVKWTADEINDVLTIEWTMFGLSLTVFLVWNVLIVAYFRKIQPTVPNRSDLIKQYEYLIEKRSFAQKVDVSFLNVVLLSINLCLLLFSSSFVYISHIPEMILTQNFVCCTFYFSTNTILSLFFDLLRPLKMDKASLKTDQQVTKSELDSALVGAIIQRTIETDIQKINDLDDLTEAEKIEQIDQCINNWKHAVLSIMQEDNAAQKQESDDMK